jgi:hypothetical protein
VVTRIPELGEELVPPGEAEATQRVVDVCLELLDRSVTPVPRQQHATPSGCVRAALHIADDIPDGLRHGLFREPRSYAALVRFSNGANADQSKRDAHGMAIKVFGVAGVKVLDDERDATTQDFVFIDNPIFFIRNVVDYALFATALRNGARYMTKRWAAALPEKARQLIAPAYMLATYLRGHPYERRLLVSVRKRPPASPLATRYWTATPYKLGPHAVRLEARPRSIHPPLRTGGFENRELYERRNCLRAGLVSHLLQRDATFDLLVQRQTNAATMPVEDPTLAWDDREAPHRVVATLHIPAQRFDTIHKRELAERLSFSAWHSLPDHRPIGGINRARRHIYVALARRRRELNRAPLDEPGADWLDRVWEHAEAPSFLERAGMIGV